MTIFSDFLKETLTAMPASVSQSVTHQVCEGKESMRDLNFSLCSSLHTRTVPEFRESALQAWQSLFICDMKCFFLISTYSKCCSFSGGGKSLRRSLNAPPFNTFQIKLKWKKHRKGLVNEVEINNKRLLQAPGCCKAGTNNTALIAGDPVEQCLCYHHSARLRDAQKYLDQKE